MTADALMRSALSHIVGRDGRDRDLVAAEQAAAELLVALGVDTASESMARTPGRMVRALDELLTPRDFDLTTFPNDEAYEQLVIEREIPFRSLCEHHFLPFGRIPLEAFAAGAGSVVATTAGGLAELVTEETGYPANPGDPESLADAIQAALAAKPEQRAAKRAAGRALAATHYHYPNVVQDFLTTVAPWATK